MSTRSATHTVDEVLRRVSSVLVPTGFAKRGASAFRRVVEDDICQLVEVFVAPAWAASQARDFCVNFDVFIPSVHRLIEGTRVEIPTPDDCQVRFALGELTAPYQKRWWSWSGGPERAVREIARMLTGQALPLLERLRSHETILRDWRALDWEEWLTPAQFNRRQALVRLGDQRAAARYLDECVAGIGDPAQFPGVLTWEPPSSVTAAVLLVERGRTEEARQILRHRYDETEHQGHLRFLRHIAEALGIPL